MYRNRLHKFTTCVLSICLVLYDNKICLKYDQTNKEKRTNNDPQNIRKKAKDRSSTHRSPRSSFLFQLNVAPYNSNCWLIRSKISGSFDFNTSVGGL
jgi:hypothetical protein